MDGNVYLDLLNNFTSLIHGHGHPRITAAIAAQAAKGTVYAAPAEVQLSLAEEITRRVPSMQRVRFTTSGTEAVMNALRVARAFTGRSKFLKMEGGYHGSYDPVEISIAPGPDGPVLIPLIAVRIRITGKVKPAKSLLFAVVGRAK